MVETPAYNVSMIPATNKCEICGLVFAVILAWLVPGVISPVRAEEPSASGNYTLAAECGRCHQDIYQSWRKTSHALAAVNPLFQENMERIDQEHGRGMRVNCVPCHSPTTLLTMDFSLARDLSREGVTCDFCHTVSAVDLARKGMKLKNDLSPVKMGPGREDSLPAHKTRKNPLLLQADFCAGCHQWTNDQGVPILNTFQEWQASFYRGEQLYCQFCHMPEILKQVVLIEGRAVERPARLHMEMGGHSQIQLATAAKLGLDAVLAEGKVEAKVTVENFKGGHMLPTGLPSRMVALEVSLTDAQGKVLATAEKVYRRRLADGQGQPLEDMLSWYLKAVSVTEDTRIAPKERRIEVFTFAPPEGTGTMIVRAKLSYRMRTNVFSPPNLDYEMASAQKVVGSGLGRPDVNLLTSGAIATLLLVVITLIIAKLRLKQDATA